MSNAAGPLKRAAGVLLVVLLTVTLWHASRFWPSGLELPLLGRDDWLHRALPPAARPWSIVLWGGACFGVLAMAQKLALTQKLAALLSKTRES